MTEQPTALRLADALDQEDCSLSFQDIFAAAAELRRLQAENENFRKHIESQNTELDKLIPMAERLEAQRDALLEALKTLLSYANKLEMQFTDADGEHRAMQQARAAIKKAEEA